MTRKQYSQLLRNRQPPAVRSLFGSRAEQQVLRAAARSVQRRTRARSVLEGVLPKALLEQLEVETLEHGTLTLVAGDPVLCERVRRDAARLQRQLAGRIPGLQRLRVCWSGGREGDALDDASGIRK